MTIPMASINVVYYYERVIPFAANVMNILNTVLDLPFNISREREHVIVVRILSIERKQFRKNPGNRKV